MNTFPLKGMWRVALDENGQSLGLQFKDIPYYIDAFGLVCIKLDDLSAVANKDGVIKMDSGSLGALANRTDPVHEYTKKPCRDKRKRGWTIQEGHISARDPLGQRIGLLYDGEPVAYLPPDGGFDGVEYVD